MTFETIELSEFSGAPIELFEFQTDSNIVRYTTNDETINFGGALYDGTFPIKRSKVEASQDQGKAPIKIKASADLPFAAKYAQAPPSSVATVSIKSYHANDTDQEAVILWLGRVTNVKFVGDEVEIRCEPIFTSLKRPALRRMYQTSCTHVLYGGACTADKTAFQTVTTITTADSQTLSSTAIDAEADGFFTGGFIVWDNNGVLERRTISSHVGADIVLLNSIPGLSTGNSVTVFPGCDHALATCINKFNNVDNYGGFPFIPGKNPFGGNSIF